MDWLSVVVVALAVVGRTTCCLETEGSPTVSEGCGEVGRASSTLPSTTLWIAVAETFDPPVRVGGGGGVKNLSCLTFRNGDCRVL